MTRALFVVAIVLLAVASTARAQQGSPRAGYVYPAGGQQGTTFQVEVGGQFLNGVNTAAVSGDGVQIRVLAYNQPLNPQQLTALRDSAQALQRQVQQAGAAVDPALRERALDMRDRITSSMQRRQNPVLGEVVRLQITIADNAEPGARKLRLQTPLGVTPPLTFVVGQLPEFREKAKKLTRADTELAITLPAVVNGQLIPGDIDRFRLQPRNQQQYRAGDVDRYRFRARAGQELVAIASARALTPYLADAVPGWFQATLRLYDAAGHEVAFVDDFGFDPDPVLHYRVPADGEYVLEVTDALYRGREDFVYRVAIGELPYVTSVFPLGARAGTRTEVALTGWNLPASRTVFDATAKTRGTHTMFARSNGQLSNVLSFAVDTLPEVVEVERNDDATCATAVTLPITVNGQIAQTGDWDVFSFQGKAGAAIVAEVYARRLGSPLDAALELTDAKGRRIAWNDDADDRSAALETHHADSWLLTKLPADGTYYLRIGDIQRKGGAAYAYRLRISTPRPDFELRVSPSFINASGGSTVPITVTAIRRDGFTGDITMDIEDALPGLILGGAIIPAGQDQIRITLTVPPVSAANTRPIPLRPNAIGNFMNRVRANRGQANQNLVPLQLVGTATIDGRKVSHRAIPADAMMQAFAYHHFVAADEQAVFIRARGATAMPASIRTNMPVRLPAGGSASIEIGMPAAYQLFENLQFQLSEPPPGITLGNVKLTEWGAVLTVHADTAASRAGQRGNLIIEVSGERPAGPNADAARRPRVVIGVLPAVRFELMARTN